MQKHFTAPTTYFLQEGRENLDECLRVSFQAAKNQNIRTLVMFTAKGDGIKKAIDEYCSQPGYAHIHLIAVSFPYGKVFQVGDSEPSSIQISDEDRQLFAKRGIPIVTAHFPFDGLRPTGSGIGPVARDMRLVADALSMLSGSMSLCVQSVTMACDAGHVGIGEHVIAMTADTSILVTATVTTHMLSDLIIREILCKPAILTIARGEASPAKSEKEEIVQTDSIGRARPRRKLTAKKRQR